MWLKLSKSLVVIALAFVGVEVGATEVNKMDTEVHKYLSVSFVTSMAREVRTVSHVERRRDKNILNEKADMLVDNGAVKTASTRARTFFLPQAGKNPGELNFDDLAVFGIPTPLFGSVAEPGQVMRRKYQVLHDNKTVPITVTYKYSHKFLLFNREVAVFDLVVNGVYYDEKTHTKKRLAGFGKEARSSRDGLVLFRGLELRCGVSVASEPDKIISFSEAMLF